MMHARSLGPLLVLVGLAAACTRDNPAYDGGSGDGTGKGTLDGAETAPTTAVLDSAGTGSGAASSSDTTPVDTLPADGTTADTETTGPMDCPPPAVDVAAYGRCAECMGSCVELQSSPPVVFNQSVCAEACDDPCQCPAPSSGTAMPTCTAAGCVLDCSGDGVCPDGMTCHAETQQCVWNQAYGPCDPSCPTGYCLLIPMVAGVCPVLDCIVRGTLEPSLCPPPAGGNATPICFEPQSPVELQGHGWCVLSCQEGETCPPGTQCTGGTCMHTF